MDNENVETPQKIQTAKTTFWTNFCLNTNDSLGKTPKNMKQQQQRCKLLQALTPNKNGASSSLSFVGILGNSRTHISSPSTRFHKVRNPFEAALAERLHLPLIGSPSLFHRPATPQMSSTQFEWTIDEVSALQPELVEAHETQFQDSPDSELESRAQLAISSYFKEQKIVPSPVNCPLRTQRLILSQIESHTPVVKPGRRIRDCSVQTELTLPTVLPKELEDALSAYFKPELAGIGHEFVPNNCISLDAANSSMRRKLFDIHNIAVLSDDDIPKSNSLIVSSPKAKQTTAFIGKLSDSLDKSTFGSLSPISNYGGFSPNSPKPLSNAKRKAPNFENDLEGAEELSPIQKEIQNAKRRSIIFIKSNYRSDDTIADDVTTSVNNNFTPERSSSPLHAHELSFDSNFYQRVSRLRVNSMSTKSILGNNVDKSMDTTALMQCDDTQEMMEEDDEMQLSTNSFNCSSSNSDTPRSKRRTANRKNLSQSFTAKWSDENDAESQSFDEDENIEIVKAMKMATVQITKNETMATDNLEKCAISRRIDSGFNDISSITSSALSQEFMAITHRSSTTNCGTLNENIVCCSTPTRKPIQHNASP